MTQDNLGLALQTLGTRETGDSRLRQAIAAYWQAPTEQTRGAHITRSNRAQNQSRHRAGKAWGEPEIDPICLQEAVTVWKEYLIVKPSTREGMGFRRPACSRGSRSSSGLQRPGLAAPFDKIFERCDHDRGVLLTVEGI
jgi:hypothetical protein